MIFFILFLLFNKTQGGIIFPFIRISYIKHNTYKNDFFININESEKIYKNKIRQQKRIFLVNMTIDGHGTLNFSTSLNASVNKITLIDINNENKLFTKTFLRRHKLLKIICKTNNGCNIKYEKEFTVVKLKRNELAYDMFLLFLFIIIGMGILTIIASVIYQSTNEIFSSFILALGVIILLPLILIFILISCFIFYIKENKKQIKFYVKERKKKQDIKNINKILMNNIKVVELHNIVKEYYNYEEGYGKKYYDYDDEYMDIII